MDLTVAAEEGPGEGEGVADPVEGGVVTILSATYTVVRRSRPDSDRLLWRLDLTADAGID